jgi:WS/DGAT/MGAT family acyltransferase
VNPDRLSSLDVAFLSMERPGSPMHLGGVAVFRPARRVNPIRLVDLLAERAARVPRLRHRVRPTWLPPGGAVWSAYPAFQPASHIHLHRLPGPGTRTQLARATSEVMETPLDRSRPLWEIHVFTGLQDGCFAVLTKLHHALADGLRAVELGVALLDKATGAEPGTPTAAGAARNAGGAGGAAGNAAGDAAGTAGTVPAGWAGPGAPSGGLPWPLSPAVAAARFAGGTLARPDRLVASALSTVAGLPMAARQTGQAVEIAASLLRTATPPAAHSPWTADTSSTSSERGLALLRIELGDVHRIRRRHGGTVNDVLLAVVTGALRRWLAGRGSPVDGLTLRALIPVSRPHRCAQLRGCNILSGYLCTLPVGEPDPLRRLHAVRAEMERNKASGPGRGAGALALLAERLPPAVHRLAGPFTGLGAPLLFDTVVTNVPLPNVPLHLAGAELRELYPIVPLAHGHALGVAVSTYRGTAHLALHADDRALPDLGRLAAAVPDALSTLDRIPHAS